MKTRFLATLATTIALLWSAQGLSSPEVVEELAKQWSDAYNQHDQDALGALYTKNAHLYMHGSSRIEGRGDITAFWASDFTVDNPITVLRVTHYVQGVDMMLVHGDYEVIGREDGSKLGQGRFAHIWLQNTETGEWRLDRDLWNQPHNPVK